MSYLSKGIVCLVASVAASFVASVPAIAVPIDYRMGYIKGTFRFDSSGPGSGEYQHEVVNTFGIFEDGFNEYVPFQPGGQNNASSTFIDNGVTMDWFEVVGGYSNQSFSFLVRNFIDNDPGPDTMGLRSYANASFLLDMQVSFFDVEDPDDPMDDIEYVETLEDFEIPLLDSYGAPVTLNPGGWFLASYEISEIGSLSGPLGANQRILQSSAGEGFLITATVPDVLFNPISVDPDPDPTTVPEPGTLALLGLGLLGLGAARRRRSGAQAGNVA